MYDEHCTEITKVVVRCVTAFLIFVLLSWCVQLYTTSQVEIYKLALKLCELDRTRCRP